MTDAKRLAVFRGKLTKDTEPASMALVAAIDARLAMLREAEVRRVLAAISVPGNRNAVQRAHLAIATFEELRNTRANS